MNTLLLALRLVRRDWRSGEVHLLILALIVAVAAVTAVGFFTNRIERALELQAAEVLAADLVISSANPIPDLFRERAENLGLSTATTLGFPSVVVHQNGTQLVNVKAVSATYPLRGELRTRKVPGSEETATPGTPESGHIWAESRLMSNLQLNPGDRVSLGEMEFSVDRILTRDSGESSNLFRLGPRLLMPIEDIPATGLVTPASRVRHQLLVAGDDKRLVEQFREQVSPELSQGIRLEDMRNARPELKTALERGGRFLALAALVAVLVAGAAVALSTRRFVDKQSDASAIMRCLGASRRLILRVLLIRLLIIVMIASLVGSLVGYLAQFLLIAMLSELFTTQLPAPDLQPVLIGLGTGLITLLGFTLAPMLRLSEVPPLRVLRRDLGVAPPGFWILGSSALAALALLMYWQTGDLKLTLIVLLGVAACVLVMILIARFLVVLLTPLRHNTHNTLRYGLAGLARNPGMTAIQLTGFGIGILALLLLAIVRVDLLDAWERTIPEQTPNHFLINIQPQEVEALDAYLAGEGLDNGGLYPMLRARLTHINGDPVVAENYSDDRAQRLVRREFNLSWAASMQDHNRLIDGEWWDREEQRLSLFSVEEGIARRLGIALGDRLRYTIAGESVEGEVSNLRGVSWDSFQPNFFVIATPGMLQAFPSTYITSFYLPPDNEQMLSELIRNFPSVTLIDVSSIMQQIREIIARGAMAVEYVFLFTLIAGALVLYAGIQTSREIRRQESAILRTMGVQKRQLFQAVAIEFILLGALAGLLASLGATLTGWAISTELFDLGYRVNPWIWIWGTLGGATGVAVAGVMATYPLVIQPPLQTLREE